MISEVISRTLENLFSFTTLVCVLLFASIFLLRFACEALITGAVDLEALSTGAVDWENKAIMRRGCGAMILMWLGEVFIVFFIVVSISPKVLGFSKSAQWALPFYALFGSFWSIFKYLIIGLVISMFASLAPISGRFHIFVYTMMSVVFYRVGYKPSHTGGYRPKIDAFKVYVPEFGVSVMIIATCIALLLVADLIGYVLTKGNHDPDHNKTAHGFEVFGSVIFAIIPIYMYGAWFGLRMQ